MRPTGSKYNEENENFLNNNTGKSYCLVDIRDKILLYFAIKCYCTYFFHLVEKLKLNLRRMFLRS